MGVLEGRTALLTGAASGIGRAAALVFAREGARLLLSDVDAEGLEESRALVQSAGGEAELHIADIADESAVQELAAAAVDRFGRIDCAFNNAGISDQPAAFEELSQERWQRMLAVNLSGVYWCMKHEVIQMKAQAPLDGMRGVICNTASGAGIVAAPGLPHYTAAKHGVLGLTKAAARELYDAGIRVNALCPGMTDTGMMREFLSQEAPAARAFVKALPGGALGRPEDVAEAALWLCSPAARWVSGEAMVVDGGQIGR